MTITRIVNRKTGAIYTFPTSPADQDYNPRLQNVETHLTALPGVDGAYDEDGLGRGNISNGTIQFSIYLVSTTRSGMQALRDSLNKISAWGACTLYDTTGAGERWAFVKLTNIDMQEKRQENTDLHQRVQLTFLVNPPFWHTAGNMLIWGSGWQWNDGSLWGGSSSVIAVSGSGGSTVTNNGSAITMPTLIAKYNSGTVEEVVFKRTLNGENLDLVRYSGALTSGQYLEINCLAQRATVQPDNTNIYNLLTFEHPDWFRLEPGGNTVTITTTGAVDCRVLFMERWK